jgi:CubicO group peptidase (beta-lactamase class C family)
MADLQAEVQAAAGELVAAGTETGLQVAVLRHGRVLADVVSGVEDPQTAKPVSPGTLFYAASTAKGVAASLAHVLAERGDITYDLRLADIWPEYAAHGKEHTTLRHVLLHTAGLPGLPQETTVADLCDWDRVCAALAAAEPWWRPGTRFGYHALTFGFLLGETLRRVTGRTMSELLREVLTGPLGIADEVCFAVPHPLLPGSRASPPDRHHPSRRSRAHRSTAPRRPRCATRPASVTAPTCSAPKSRRSAR